MVAVTVISFSGPIYPSTLISPVEELMEEEAASVGTPGSPVAEKVRSVPEKWEAVSIVKDVVDSLTLPMGVEVGAPEQKS